MRKAEGAGGGGGAMFRRGGGPTPWGGIGKKHPGGKSCGGGRDRSQTLGDLALGDTEKKVRIFRRPYRVGDRELTDRGKRIDPFTTPFGGGKNNHHFWRRLAKNQQEKSVQTTASLWPRDKVPY